MIWWCLPKTSQNHVNALPYLFGLDKCIQNITSPLNIWWILTLVSLETPARATRNWYCTKLKTAPEVFPAFRVASLSLLAASLKQHVALLPLLAAWIKQHLALSPAHGDWPSPGLIIFNHQLKHAQTPLPNPGPWIDSQLFCAMWQGLISRSQTPAGPNQHERSIRDQTP